MSHYLKNSKKADRDSLKGASRHHEHGLLVQVNDKGRQPFVKGNRHCDSKCLSYNTRFAATDPQTFAFIHFLLKIMGFKRSRYKYNVIHQNRTLIVLLYSLHQGYYYICKTCVVMTFTPLMINGTSTTPLSAREKSLIRLSTRRHLLLGPKFLHIYEYLKDYLLHQNLSCIISEVGHEMNIEISPLEWYNSSKGTDVDVLETKNKEKTTEYRHSSDAKIQDTVSSNLDETFPEKVSFQVDGKKKFEMQVPIQESHNASCQNNQGNDCFSTTSSSYMSYDSSKDSLFDKKVVHSPLKVVKKSSKVSDPNVSDWCCDFALKSLDLKNRNEIQRREVMLNTRHHQMTLRDSVLQSTGYIKKHLIHIHPAKHLLSPVIYPVSKTNPNPEISIHRLMKYEILRIRSFNRDITMPVYSITQLAQHGFYCSGANGQVACFNCSLNHPTFLSGLALDETSHERDCDSTRESNNVPLFKGTSGLSTADLTVFNAFFSSVPTSFENSRASSVYQASPEENHVYVFYTSAATNNVEILPSEFWRLYNESYTPDADDFLNLNGAAYPLFANRKTRRDTFHSWDPTHSQKPEDLVALGFFFAGYSDCARCFYCGLGLKYWRPNDDAAFQHARFRPQCKYNQFVKGQEFVDRVQRSIATETQAGNTNANTEEVPNIDQLMRSSAAKQLLDEGWERQEVQTGVAKLVSDLGEECLSYDILMEVLINNQAERGAQPDRQARQGGKTNTAGSSSSRVDTPAKLQTVLSDTTHDGVHSSQDDGTMAIGDEIDSPMGSGRENEESLDPSVAFRLVEREHNYRKKRMNCMACGKSKIGCIYLPCGHVVACQPCGDLASTCILCGKVIAAIANIYLS